MKNELSKWLSARSNTPEFMSSVDRQKLNDAAKLINTMSDEVDTLKKERTKLRLVRDCARDFIKQYEYVIQSDRYKSIWVFLHVHNMEYRGPIFNDPKSLCEALEGVPDDSNQENDDES